MMTLLLLLTTASAVEQLPLECPPGRRAWGRISGLYDADKEVFVPTTDKLRVYRDQPPGTDSYWGRLGADLCVGDRLETWHGIEVTLTLPGASQVVLSEAAHLRTQEADGVFYLEQTEGTTDWYLHPEAQRWYPKVVAKGVEAVQYMSSFRLTVVPDRQRPDRPPSLRVAVAPIDPDGDRSPHSLTLLYRGERHTVRGGTVKELYAGGLLIEVEDKVRTATQAALTLSLRRSYEELRRAEQQRGPVAYDTVPHDATWQGLQRSYTIEVGTQEISRGLWEEVMGMPFWPSHHACKPPDPAWGDDHPVTCVTWPEAALFANALSRRAGLTPLYRATGTVWFEDKAADGYRLPTREEWESLLDRGDPMAGDVTLDDVRTATSWCPANLAGTEMMGAMTGTLHCQDAEPGLAARDGGYQDSDGLFNLFGNVAERLSCAHEGPCEVAGGSWLTGAALLRQPQLVEPLEEEVRDDVGFRLVLQRVGR